MGFYDPRPGESADQAKARWEAAHARDLVDAGLLQSAQTIPEARKQVDAIGKDVSGYRREVELRDIKNAGPRTVETAVRNKLDKGFRQWVAGKGPASALSVNYGHSALTPAQVDKQVRAALQKRAASSSPATQYRDIYTIGRDSSGKLIPRTYDAKAIQSIAPKLKIQRGNPSPADRQRYATPAPARTSAPSRRAELGRQFVDRGTGLIAGDQPSELNIGQTHAAPGLRPRSPNAVLPGEIQLLVGRNRPQQRRGRGRQPFARDHQYGQINTKETRGNGARFCPHGVRSGVASPEQSFTMASSGVL